MLEPVSASSSNVAGKELLSAVAEISDLLQSGASVSDRQGWLVDASASALRSCGFWRMRLCRELGGLELPIVTQIEVLAALAAEDASTAWCTMVANNATAILGATLPQAAIDRIFAGGVPTCSIVTAPGGIATPTEGGYILNGTWRLAASIHHASWIHATTHIDRDPSRLLPIVVPSNDVKLLDSWKVVGLAGTGSNDFSLTNYFVPGELTGNEHNPYGQLRGVRRYDLLDIENLESYEHFAFAIGVGRRVLRELCLILTKSNVGRCTGDREVVQRQLGQAAVKLQAVETMAYALYARIDACAAGQMQSWSYADRHLPRALAVSATELALECTQLAFHRAMAAALYRPNIFEKLLRDMSVAATHVAVDDTAFASYAQDLIEKATPLSSTAMTSRLT